ADFLRIVYRPGVDEETFLPGSLDEGRIHQRLVRVDRERLCLPRPREERLPAPHADDDAERQRDAQRPGPQQQVLLERDQPAAVRSTRSSCRQTGTRSRVSRTSSSTSRIPSSTARRNDGSVFSGANPAAPRCPTISDMKSSPRRYGVPNLTAKAQRTQRPQRG